MSVSKYGAAARNAAANAIGTLCDNGYVRIYTGAQPATPDSVATGTLLAELRFAATAFGASVAGVITAAAIATVAAAATGTAGYVRALKSDGTTAVFDGDVGTSAAALILNSTAIQSGATVQIASLTYTQPATGT